MISLSSIQTMNKKKTEKNKLYEAFHARLDPQKYIINRNNFTYRNIVDMLDKYTKNAKTVFDIGCGSGTLSFYLANKGKKVIGVDISKNSIAACKQNAEKLNLSQQTSFAVMEFPNKLPQKKFDVILMMEVIEHIEDDKKALKAVYSLLNKDGIAIITTPSKNAPLHRLGYAKGFDKRVGHLRRYTMEEIVTKCKEAKFEIVETKKTEGILRNFLFLNPIAGNLIRVIKSFLIDVALFLDDISRKLFGESDLFVIVKKK